MSEENKAASRRIFEAFASGDLDALDDLVAVDLVDHDPYAPFPGEGLEGVKKQAAMYRDAFPDLRFTIEDQIAEGDLVVTRWTGTGTHEGALMGFEPTGKESGVTGIGIDRFANGKVVETWSNWDTLALMQNIGAVPTEAAARA